MGWTFCATVTSGEASGSGDGEGHSVFGSGTSRSYDSGVVDSLLGSSGGSG